MTEQKVRPQAEGAHPGPGSHFLRRLLGYQRVCIQCHNNPDADTLAANQIAAWVCDGIGGGGGHRKKAGGRIILDKMRQRYGDQSIFDVVNLRLCQYVDEHPI